MSEPITIFIVDDHAVVRQGVRAWLRTHEDLRLVGEAESGDEALPQIAELVPDVVLVDLVLPGNQRSRDDPSDQTDQSTDPDCGPDLLCRG
jgi:DNA-binding NarL/FixJ family response regulator